MEEVFYTDEEGEHEKKEYCLAIAAARKEAELGLKAERGDEQGDWDKVF